MNLRTLVWLGMLVGVALLQNDIAHAASHQHVAPRGASGSNVVAQHSVTNHGGTNSRRSSPENSIEEDTLRDLSPPVLLPDGSSFQTWEAPPAHSRTYYVSGRHPVAKDTNPGTAERPFKTIAQAARVLMPGERVVVGAGIYRERVTPPRGGLGPSRMISYEAQPGAEVIVKGSEPFAPEWRPSTLPGVTNAWQARLAPELFGPYNPFNIDNVTPTQFKSMDWAEPLQGTPPCTLTRGQLFQAGKPLRQIAVPAGLSTGEGTFWVDRSNQVVHVRPHGDREPGTSSWEITVRETLFSPDTPGLGYVRVKGFTFEHAAGPWPWEQVGAISTCRGHHWIIEGNTVRWANGVGIDVGSTHPGWPQPARIGFHIVRRNRVTDCGICGIAGLGPGNGVEFGLLIEDNVLARNAWFDIERLYETAAIKTHNNVRCLIRRNLILDTRHGPGIWMDWNNQFSRCSQNLIVNTRTIHGGIFVEASYEPNLIDQNIVLDTEGHGIYEHDSCNQVFVHNLAARGTRSGAHLHGQITQRRIANRPIVGGRHEVLNNIFILNQSTNEYRGEPSVVEGNILQGAQLSFNRKTWELGLRMDGVHSVSKTLPRVTRDWLGGLRSGMTIPGPFAKESAEPHRLWPMGPFSPPAEE